MWRLSGRRAGSKRRRRQARGVMVRLLKQARHFCRGAREPEGWGTLFEGVQATYAGHEADLPPQARLRLGEEALQIQEDSTRQALDAA